MPDGTFRVFREGNEDDIVNADIIHSLAETADHRQLWLATEDGIRFLIQITILLPL